MLVLMFYMDSPCSCGHFEMCLTFVGPLVPKLYAFKKNILMQDPDPKCRHFVISWHFMAFWHVCQKANCITKSAFSAFSRLFASFTKLDFSALIEILNLSFKMLV